MSRRWDDLRFPATGVSIGQLSTPPDVDTSTGLLLFDATANETIAILAQMPHAWAEYTDIRPHVHWRKTTDATGDVIWSLRYRWFNFQDTEPSWSSLITATDVQGGPGATQQQAISTFGDVSGDGKEISSLFLCQVGRLATDANDTYAADAVLYEFDIHYLTDIPGGSAGEFYKVWRKGVHS